MTVLLFGVGTDYALIIFARFREALVDSDDPTVAVAAAMRNVSTALLASVSTIVAAVLALLTAVTPTLHDFGPYLAVGVLSMAAVAFTLTPALLVITGRSAFWPRRRPTLGVELPESRLWSRIADLATGKPRRVLTLGLAGLALASAGLIGVGQSFDLVSGFRIDTESATGRDMLAGSFGPGTIAPSQVIVQADAPIEDAQAQAIVAALATTPGVAHPGGVTWSQDRRTLGVDVTLDANPFAPEALDLVPDLQASAEAAARKAGLGSLEVLVGGETSIAADTRTALDRDLRVAAEALRTAIVRTGGVISSAGVVLAGTFAVLMTQPIRELYQFGLAMAIGILLDTFIIRPLLVPACIQMLGHRALWPSALEELRREPVSS